MSPEGISVFYGALDRSTCISELRPLVGDIVISGEFKAQRELKLLDLNKLVSFNPNIDIFHEDFIQFSHAAAFFKELVFQMSRPARRVNRNPYLSTQVIFEYLSLSFNQQVDGLMYLSVQQNKSGGCVALFPKSFSPSFIDDSLKYHRIRGVSFDVEQYDDDLIITADDQYLNRVGLAAHRS